MRFEIKDKIVTFYIEDSKRDVPIRRPASFKGTLLSDEDAIRLCTSFHRMGQRMAASTQAALIKDVLKPLFAYLKDSSSQLPINSNAWQLFLLNFLRWYLTTKSSKATSKSRVSVWSCSIHNVLNFFKNEGLIPVDVHIPTLPKRSALSDSTAHQTLIETTAKQTPNNRIHRNNQKMLVSVDFAKSDTDYLDSIERECREKIKVIKDTCLSHWGALMADGKKGKLFYEEIGITEIERIIQSQEHSVTKIRKIRTDKFGRIMARNDSSIPHSLLEQKIIYPIAHPLLPDGHKWGIALARHWLNTECSPGCIKLAALIHSGFFPSSFLNGPKYSYSEINLLSAMPKDVLAQLNSLQMFYRFCGVLSGRDVAAACCLLMIEHPQFTSQSLQNAKLLSTHGKSYLTLSDNPNSPIFSVDKPRAGTLKYATLSPLSKEIIEDIIEWTAPARRILRQAGSKAWRFLFLGADTSTAGLQALKNIQHSIANRSGKNLLCLYPALREAGLTHGNFGLSRIRHTMGVLRWFETGSIVEMSQRLGNTQSVALQHYLPPSLMRAWNTRIIRRFQNTLIVLAAYDEDYLMEVTDFTTIGDLQHFIAQLIFQFPINSSPIGDAVQARLGPALGYDVASENSRALGVLNIRLSPKSLGYLYAFSDFATTALNDEQLTQVDLQTKLTPAQFVDVARLIRVACESETVAPELGELMDLSQLRIVHSQALLQKSSIESRMKKLSIHQRWSS